MKKDEVRLELHQIDPDSTTADNPLSHLYVELVTENNQRDTSMGLIFVIAFKNRGRTAVEIQDPDDMVQLDLLDSQGRPVRIPGRPPNALINQRVEGQIHSNAPRTLSIQPGREHKTSLAVREMQGLEPSSTAPLPRGTYTAQVRVLLLTIDPKLGHKESYRALESAPVSIKFGE